jgi:Amt family ammonium transporter
LGKSVKAEGSTSNNLVLSVIGASLLWVGWFGFNAGSAVAANAVAGMAMLVTNTAAAAGGLTWVLLERIIKGKPSVVGGISGIVAGLVGITPAAGFVGFGASLVIGFAAAGICFLAVAYIKEKLGYDDSLDAFGIHGVGGIVGGILTGVFASTAIGGTAGMIEGNSAQVVAQIIKIVICGGYSAVMTFIILSIMKRVMRLRVAEDIEKNGLDVALHGDEVTVYRK